MEASQVGADVVIKFDGVEGSITILNAQAQDLLI